MSTTPEPERNPGPHAAPEADSAPETDPRPTPDPAPETESGTPAPAKAKAKAAAARLIFDDPLNQQSSDDTDRGWGDRPAGGGGAADLARFLDEKPPHHL
ncbi:hypothetical protein ACF082_31455 [Streptomyces lydicus]|uniref:hypothetical protein n=1 Tax=Streptomyces lydicus TaxID=47763 RepID=UPI0036F4D7C4